MKGGVASPITIDGRTTLATKTTAGIVKRVMRENRVRVVDIEQYLYGERARHMSERLLEHRHQNTIKAISRARKFLVEVFGDEGWLNAYKMRDGKFGIEFRSAPALGPFDRVSDAKEEADRRRP